ncbi:hypothetical protein COCC4DRAFT_141955 [Bipolaris maydis ATCC 48331]|uniref:Zona occludens toxin N-terminal domain-containing protein n=2 Tax=Cochliobolus heterostrophus TaxID=5016 RepID=M2USV2_COCH5|nr:uncharacterized protein COCC4DRAFT_141955 [Bipolaris maydis ATCC 48331]EMD96676.1 hypothetical protein COCHEDRAFT_1150374 [Bipolaris maydis C5]KAJ5031434.1 hypothetical protein J3E73DRAFT_179542 [Bipolaris maydis]ENI03543.1 hypothetical protein COCC4DRAFT_141955 [Bipolaris maydis ATCC 48331]KAJ5031443.1 hypothetical protein J3E73DRAFT_180192 [Bipolaris maydis]KAJ5060517.1 hypothetical protein J3E74DRAFT_428711 [Bipolaris maydis]
MAGVPELIRYQSVLRDRQNTGPDETNTIDPMVEELRMAPLVWWNVKEHVEPQQQVQRGYAVLGHVPEANNRPQDDSSVSSSATRSPVLLNTDSPWSAFLCGSQGSGKSHTLSCMLENCLLTDKTILPRVGLNPHPLAGLVFHYDRCQGSGVCEAAYLCTNIPTTVLTILMILRKMAIKSQGLGTFDYITFKNELSATKFTSGQDGPMKLRLDLLESFMKDRKKGSSTLANTENDFLTGTPGSLTIVDLTDPVIDADSACVLFDICLSVFIQQTQCGKIVALDEAHNYMTEGSGAAKAFTEKLLRTVREQRHQAVRVVIATQEPSINTQLLDLCSITMVHRCTSPAWFNVLKRHVAALYLNLPTSSQAGASGDEKVEGAKDDTELFLEIVRLKLGESLLFCPSAVIKVVGEEIERMEGRYVKFKTRQRVTADGGRSLIGAAVESCLMRVQGGGKVLSETGRKQGHPRTGRVYRSRP